MKRFVPRAVVVLDFESLDVPRLVAFTRAVANKGLTGNSNLTAADAAKLPYAVTDLLGLASTLETTNTSRPTSPSKATTNLERDQSSALMNAMKDTASFVEGIANKKANGDLTLAESIITSFGFHVKARGVKKKKGFNADSLAKGTADVYVPTAEKNAVRVIRYSTDGEKTWSGNIIVHGTVIGIAGLKSGTEVAVQWAKSLPPAKRTKQIITVGSEDLAWSDSVTCIVK